RWRHDSLQRLQANLDALALLALAEPAAGHLADAGRAGAALLAAAAAAAPVSDPQAPTPAGLARADQCAEDLLAAADALTDAVEAASGRRSLQVVNLCGRQRMLSQRLAKQALLSALLPGPAADAQAAAAAQTLADFEAALRALEQAPLASDEIRAALAQARGEWLRLLQAVRQTAGGAVPAALARESEALLASFEQLTSLVEHSMQVLLG
ncbi:MAG: antitermination regulator, partial [Burkholderiales bacterium PBB5]